MKTVIKEGRCVEGPLYVKRCKHCWCKFTFEPNDIKHAKVYGFEHLIFVECPWCKSDIWLNRLKFFKKNKR